jgi:hypothetical protein
MITGKLKDALKLLRGNLEEAPVAVNVEPYLLHERLAVGAFTKREIVRESNYPRVTSPLI